MADFSVYGQINGDASGFVGAVNSAKESLSSLTEIAGGVFAGLGAAGLFETITGGLANMLSGTVNTANEFQTWGTVINTVADDTSSAFTGMGGASDAAGKKAAAAALEAQDALIRYNEKVKEIQSNIAEVMGGQNILDEQKALYQKLDDLATQHADKVQQLYSDIDQSSQDLADREASRQQNMNDTLADMVAGNENKKADTTEKRQQELSRATNDFTKQMLEQKYAQEDKLTNDSFQRQYDLKKQQLQRNIDEENTKDEQQTNKKIARLQEQLAKENTMYDQQQAKLMQQSDARVEKDKEENAKKLAQYQQELADEERSYQLSLARRAASGASGGGAGGAAGLLKLDKNFEGAGDSLSKTKSSAKELEEYLEKISDTTPFKLEDLEQVSQIFVGQGVNAKAMIPTIEQISGYFQVKPEDVTRDVMMAMHGRAMQLKNDFGITQESMQDALGRPIKTSNDVLEALQKIGDTKFSKGIQVETDTAGKHMTQLDNQVRKAQLAIMGIGLNGVPISGGLFDTLTSQVQNLSDFLTAHQKDIKHFVDTVSKGIGDFVKFLSDHWGIIQLVLKGIGILIAGAFAASAIGAILGVVTAILSFVELVGIAFTVFGAIGPVAVIVGGLIAAIGGPIILVGIAVAALAYLFIFHFNDIKKIAGEVGKWIMDRLKDVGNFFSGVWKSSVKLLSDGWNTAMQSIQDGVTGAVNWISKQFGTVQKTLSDIFKGLEGFFQQQVSNFLQWGKNLGNTFINGIKEALKNIGSVLTGPIEAAFKMFKGKSPPEEGPLQDIDTWGFNIGMAWVGGFTNAIGNITAVTPNLGAGLTMGAGGMSTSSSQVYNQTTNSPSVSMTNTFNVKGEANAMNVAEYIGFQLEHRGLI